MDAAAPALHDRRVIAVTGARGLDAMEIDTPVRHGARIVMIGSNTAAWNIKRLDPKENHDGRVVSPMLRFSRHAGQGRAGLRDAIRRAPDNAPLVEVATLQEAVSFDAGKGLGFAPGPQLTAWNKAERAPATCADLRRQGMAFRPGPRKHGRACQQRGAECHKEPSS